MNPVDIIVTSNLRKDTVSNITSKINRFFRTHLLHKCLRNIRGVTSTSLYPIVAITKEQLYSDREISK